jgi:hypothetical protein
MSQLKSKQDKWHEQVSPDTETCDICVVDKKLPKIRAGVLHWLWVRQVKGKARRKFQKTEKLTICNPHKKMIEEMTRLGRYP